MKILILSFLFQSLSIFSFSQKTGTKFNSDSLTKIIKRLRSLTILDFVEEKIIQQPPIIASKEFRDIVNQTYNQQDLRGMRLLSKDITNWAKDLDKMQISEIDQILKKKLGEGLYNDQKNIQGILSKGKIENLADYEILFDYIE